MPCAFALMMDSVPGRGSLAPGCSGAPYTAAFSSFMPLSWQCCVMAHDGLRAWQMQARAWMQRRMLKESKRVGGGPPAEEPTGKRPKRWEKRLAACV